MDISKLLEIGEPENYKLHAARWNGENQPLDVFLENRNEWHKWNCWFGTKHEFNRPYILSMIDFYPERNIWLFGGIYEVEHYKIRPPAELIKSHAYKAVLTDISKNLIGRLKLKISLSRGRTFRLEGQLSKMEAVEILRSPYTGPSFPGYDNATLKYSELVSIIQNERMDWKTALGNMKGVYLITLATGQHYIGSAYGNVGLWSRWSTYAKTMDGGNIELRSLNFVSNGKFIEGARFTIIEAWPMRTEDDLIIQRENYWKIALSSREHGLNLN